jgi:Tyrosine phosphatase family
MPGESMCGVLEEVDRRYGGAESYLRASGLPKADVHRIRARLRA